MKSNFKVRTKLLFIVGLLTVFLVFVFIIGSNMTSFVNDGIKSIHNDRVVPLTQLKIISDMYAVNIVDACHKVRNGNFDWVQGINSVAEAKKAIDSNWNAYKKTFLVEEEKKLITELEPLFNIADNAIEKIMDIMKAQDKEAIAKFTIDELYPTIDPVTEKIARLIDVQLSVAGDIYKNTQQIYTRNTTIMIVSIIFGIILALTIAFMIIRGLLKQLGGEPSDVVTIANTLAQGDFTVEVDIKKGDEKSALAAIKKMVENLQSIISSVIVGSQSLAHAVEEIASGNQNLSQRTSEQASSIEEIASTIEETVSSITINSENADEANKLSDASSKLAQEGGTLANEAVMSINEINQTSKKISDITNIINELAFQTNLLALNAAVEAARAGEQGRGFAVVAGEVRNLAQRSGTAAKEIGSLINTSVGMIERGTEMVNKSGTALSKIIDSIKSLNSRVSDIAVSSIEQKKGITQINNAIIEMDNMTQQNAALVEETATASEEMSNQAQALIKSVEKFRIRH